MAYQAMPEDCPLLERSRQDPEFGSLLEFFSSIAIEGTTHSAQKWIDFSKAAKQTIQQYPGLESRYLSFGRKWDKLYYLLSESRRQEYRHPEPSPNLSLIEKALFGSEILHPNVQTTTGFRIAYLLPKDVSVIASLFAEIMPELLHSHFNPLAMRELYVYKIRGDEDESELVWIQQDFEALRDFYMQVAEHNEGVIICLS